MKYLLDTCAISETYKKDGNEAVKRFIQTTAAERLLISVISIGEIYYGILKLPSGRKKDSLVQWLEQTQDYFAEQIIPFDTETAMAWGQLGAQSSAKGFNTSSVDLQIAASAYMHGLTLVTRNVKDFSHLPVQVYNPWG